MHLKYGIYLKNIYKYLLLKLNLNTFYIVLVPEIMLAFVNKKKMPPKLLVQF